ncbi:hypothetical protein GIB67_016192 [Kingdonia uniflora]|uniref:Aldehyde dehydrogenase domain-containing protein n=1 Tax=Kingdonia uniflora TaxID=39325 RepID=A0A7J7LSV8_9MAGN|nr:hypothetical protein GIB67_016192 [Kingdonia uniflora]
MMTTKIRLPSVFFPATGEVLPEPLVVVLILSSWNYPICSALALDPLIGAIAAGNAVVLKPSELAPACSALLANTTPSYMDDKSVMVVKGGTSIGKQLLDQKWDKIFFTVHPCLSMNYEASPLLLDGANLSQGIQGQTCVTWRRMRPWDL